MLLIVGADNVDSICTKLQDVCSDDIIHWSGRSMSCKKKMIPVKVNQVIVFCDFVNHPLMWNIKKQAKRHNIPVRYCKYSGTCLTECISGCKYEN